MAEPLPPLLQKMKPKAASMAELRKLRRDAGFVEVSVWVPEDKRERLKKYAARLVKECDRDLPTKPQK